MRSKDVLPGVFSRHAAAYRDSLSRALRRGEAPGRGRVARLLDVRRGERVLDLGCGPGTLTAVLAGSAGSDGRCVAVDLAPGMLALARAAVPPGVLLARMDMERLGLREAVFDAAACGHALQFCPDLSRALAEARRVLRDGGRFAASVPAPVPPGPVQRAVDEVLSPLLPPAPELEDETATRLLVARRDELRRALEAAGFRSVAVAAIEEVTRCDGPRELVERTLGWWRTAWRLEALPEAERDAVRERALAGLRERLGDGPVEVAGTSFVTYGER